LSLGASRIKRSSLQSLRDGATTSATGELVAPRTNALRPFAVPGNRDFNVGSFRSNVVLRWEWRPGSIFYLVWQQNRSSFEPVGTRASIGDMFNSIAAPGDHVLAVKTTFWMSPH
jgi:hypothetical protein